VVEYRPRGKYKLATKKYTSEYFKNLEGELTTNMVRKDPTSDMTSPEKAQQSLKQRIR